MVLIFFAHPLCAFKGALRIKKQPNRTLQHICLRKTGLRLAVKRVAILPAHHCYLDNLVQINKAARGSFNLNQFCEIRYYDNVDMVALCLYCHLILQLRRILCIDMPLSRAFHLFLAWLCVLDIFC
jgi:hypothetical protein